MDGALKFSPYVQGLQNVFTDGNYSDLIVTCKDRTWNVHRLVLCTQSEFFRKACDGGFAEAKEHKITLVEDEPEVVDAMLYYLYHFDYEDTKEGGLPAIILNMKLVALADKYLIKSLQTRAIEKFNSRAYKVWSMFSFAETLHYIFESDVASDNVDTLKLIVLEVVKKHAKELFTEDAHTHFQQATLSAPKFLLEYARSVAIEQPSGTAVTGTTNVNWYKCPGPQCKKYNVVFGVHNTVPAHFKFKCPLSCRVGNDPTENDAPPRNQTFWSSHKTMIGVSENNLQLGYRASASQPT